MNIIKNKLAIKGHPTRGKEVIELLEMMGGINNEGYIGTNTWKDEYYFLDDGGIHAYDWCDGIKFTLEEFLDKYPFKVGDKVGVCGTNKVFTIGNMIWEDKLCTVYYYDSEDVAYYTSDELELYKETNMKENTILNMSAIDYNNGLVGYEIPKGYEFDTVIDNKVVLKKLKPTYPKTYVECCEVIANSKPYAMNNENKDIDYILQLLKSLFICRNAYWQIAGEEMGLGKPWEPNWTTFEGMPAIFRFRYNIVCDSIKNQHCLLVFPTIEMRDAFYENFKDLIEECKELL